MDDDEKILVLEKLLAKASKRLNSLFHLKEFYLFENFNLLFELGTHECMVKKVNENTNATFQLIFTIYGNHMIEKSKKIKHSLKSIINRWKKSKNRFAKDILLQIMSQMENAVEAGYSIGIEFGNNDLMQGLLLWHAKVPIEQLAIELDIAN